MGLDYTHHDSISKSLQYHLPMSSAGVRGNRVEPPMVDATDAVVDAGPTARVFLGRM
jgi:hypothetical protein